MFNKLQKLNIYKIGSLAVLLGLFGLFGSSTFAAGNGIVSTTCGATQAAYLDQEWTGHNRTCEADNARNAACGTTSNAQTCFSPRAGDTCSIKCCLCDKPLEALQGNGITGLPVTPPADTSTKLSAQELCKAQGSDYQWQNGACVSCNAPGVCCGVKLNTKVPFIGNCIRLGKGADTADTTVVTDTTAFPRLMGGLTKILTTIILLVCFGGILVGGVMIAASGGDDKRAGEGKKLIGKVIIAIALLGTSGIILHLINPNFFG